MHTQILDGIWLMAAGMGTVVGFLLVLVAAMHGAARIVQWTGDSGVATPAPAEEDEAAIAAAIAIARAYSRN